MKISEIAKLSTIELKTIAPENSVKDAVSVLNEFNIGALPVCDEAGSLVGILSERDVLRLCGGKDVGGDLEQPVRAVMTKDLIVGVPGDDVDYVMRVMTENRIRHLPILEDGKLVGIISIGDVVKAKHEATETEVRFLRDYVQT